MKSVHLLRPHYDEKGYDVIVSRPELGLFAVFDGMGTNTGARRASKLAAGILESHMLSNQNPDWRALAYAFQHFIDVSKRDRSIGGTTGVAVSVAPGGTLHYVSVGDSRLYVLHDGRVKQVTSDEGVENMLLNYLGAGSLGVAQAGYIASDQWRRFCLVSDGITGDRAPDLVADADIESCLRATSIEDTLRQLFEVSTKQDDKSVIVVEQ